MARTSQTALQRYKARRGFSGAQKSSSGLLGLSGAAQWKMARVFVLLVLLAGVTWPLIPRTVHPIQLTYELDLTEAPEGSLTITVLAEGKLPDDLDLEFPPGVFGDNKNGVNIGSPSAHAITEEGSQGHPLIIDATGNGYRIQTQGTHRAGLIYRVDLQGNQSLETDIRRHISTTIKGGLRAAGFEIFLEPVGVPVEDITVTVHNPANLKLLVPWPALLRGHNTVVPANDDPIPVQDAHLGFGDGFQPGRSADTIPATPSDSSETVEPVPANLFYHPLDLADLNNSLIICGDIRIQSDQARDCVIQFATDRTWYFEDDRVMNLVRSIARTEIGFFGSAPSDQITVLLAANEVKSPDGFDVYGVHTGNSVLVMIDPETTWGVLQEQASSVIAHEMFHGWLGEAIPQTDPEMLWFTEGATTWYASRILAAAGIWDREHARQVIKARLERDYAGSDLLGTIPIAEAASQVMASNDVVRYSYAGGVAACVALDQYISENSGQRAPMDMVLRHLYQSRDGSGLTRAKLEEVILTLTNVDCKEWLDTFVYGTRALPPLDEQLASR